MIKFIGAFSLAGFVIPCLVTVVWKILLKNPDLYLSIGNIIIPFQALFWPSHILVVVSDLSQDSKGIDYGILTISIIVNIILYSVIGFLLWWGWNRQKWVLIVVGSAITMGWYKILRLLEIV